MVDTIHLRGGKATVAMSSQGIRRAYFNLLSANLSYVNTTKFTAGYSEIALATNRGELPYVVDISAPKESMTFVSEDHIKLYSDADWSFQDLGGSKWERITDKDQWVATLVRDFELGTYRRNVHGRIEDLTEE